MGGNDPQPADGEGTPESSSGAAVAPATVSPDMVLMKDHIAVKKGLEDERDKQKESHIKIVGDLNAQVNALTNTNSQLQARVETLEEEGKNLQSASEELATVKAQVTGKDEQITKLTTTLMESQVARLIDKGIPKDKLEGLNVEQLGLIESTLGSIASVSSTPGGGYAAGGGSGGGAAPTTQLEAAKQLIADARERQGKSSAI